MSNTLKNEANQYRLSPSPLAWQRLEQKLHSHNNVHNNGFRQYFYHAAAVLFIIACTLVFTFQENNIGQKYTSKHQQSYILASLESDGDLSGNIYEIHKLKTLRLAYAKLGTKVKI